MRYGSGAYNELSAVDPACDHLDENVVLVSG